MDVDEFIERWKTSGGSERANYQLFIVELCDLLGVERPNPSKAEIEAGSYQFEKPVRFSHNGGSTGFVDVYKAGHFVLETKQGVDKKKAKRNDVTGDVVAVPTRTGHGVRGSSAWDDTMLRARSQADGYARAVVKEDGWPPFLIVADVGHVFEIYSDFTKTGRGYTQFPDGTRYQIFIDDLRKEETRSLLKAIWTDPLSLDPSLSSAAVTRDIAAHLAALGKSFEAQGHESGRVARFLMRCLFTMFSEDVELIPNGSFTELLQRLKGNAANAAPTLQSLWETMDTGGFSVALTQDLKRFNGGLFKESEALPLNEDQLSLLLEAAEADWKQVEPAIFGTLLERALDKRQRHKLGAHFTPRSYVERLVVPTIIEPLREDWKNILAAVQRLNEDGKKDEAVKTVRKFHAELCEIKVLDPACGSGNFLYVALEMMKRLEGEVIALLEELEDTRPILTVDPHQFLGIEINPWAASVAELVLWIGYLQWHFRTFGKTAPAEPILRDFKNIKNADAILDWDDKKFLRDESGNTVTRWDGVTTKRHPVTGEEVPDPEYQAPIYDYVNPKASVWPQADFVVGNPPFIGNKKMRDDLGDGYVEALWKAYPKMPQSADFVMYWWEKAALAVRAFDKDRGKGARRFGLITTNSITMIFNTRVTQPHLAGPKNPLSLVFAIPDHPWVDSLFGAAVRIGMTVATKGNRPGNLWKVASESREKSEAEGKAVHLEAKFGKILANLNIGADILGTKPLMANSDLGYMGVIPVSLGFVLTEREANDLGYFEYSSGTVLKRYMNGSNLVDGMNERIIIDFFGYSLEAAQAKHPSLIQILQDRVKPFRDQVRRKGHRENWWLFGEQRHGMRKALSDLNRYIVTVETAKHRFFAFLSSDVLPDQKLRVFALADAVYLSLLSSKTHLVWALARGGTLEDRPVYNGTVCFDPFPFPDLTDIQEGQLRVLGEKLDAHRKERQAANPNLTLTQMYNVLEKLRAGEAIEGRDREIYDQGLVGILRDLHDQIDDIVAQAYGWPTNLSDEEILFRLVDLNKERAKEEASGKVRWLRPEFQNPSGTTEEGNAQAEIEIVSGASVVDKLPWPKALPEQIAAVKEALEAVEEASAEEVARTFKRAQTRAVKALLESLVALGQAQHRSDDKYQI